jgi:ABC-2 type transport system permease protein
MTSLVLTHTRFQLTDTFRTPIAVIGSMFFPAASMVFFVVPFVGSDRIYATYATASMVTFSVLSTNLFQYGIGVAEDRTQPWDPYTRTLPVGPGPRFAGRIIAGLLLTALSLLPVLLIAALFTAATITPAALLAAIGATAVIAVPFTLLGLGIGYSLPPKAAIVVAQVLFIPLAFGGGLMSAPGGAPGFIEVIAPYLPTGGAGRLMWAAVGDFPFDSGSFVALLGWCVALGLFAISAYRRDEGRRFS